jgi:hypothetical protein
MKKGPKSGLTPFFWNNMYCCQKRENQMFLCSPCEERCSISNHVFLSFSRKLCFKHAQVFLYWILNDCYIWNRKSHSIFNKRNSWTWKKNSFPKKKKERFHFFCSHLTLTTVHREEWVSYLDTNVVVVDWDVTSVDRTSLFIVLLIIFLAYCNEQTPFSWMGERETSQSISRSLKSCISFSCCYVATIT